MLFVVVLMFTICWLPIQSYNFLSVIFQFINSFEFINILWFCFQWLVMSNSCYNPFIYAFHSYNFKTVLFKRIPVLTRILPSSRRGNIVALPQLNIRTNEQDKNSIIGNSQVTYNPLQQSVPTKINQRLTHQHIVLIE